MLPTLSPATAFVITALASWSLAGLLWVVGRSYPRQGVAWIMASLSSAGAGYLLFSLSSTWPMQTTMLAAYAILSLGSSLASLGVRRFLALPWNHWDRFILALALLLPLCWGVLAAEQFALRVRLTNAGFVLQLLVLIAVIWHGRHSIVGHGWKVMLAGAIVQGLTVLPFALPGAPPSTVDHVAQSLGEQVVSWALCIMMFLNLQLSALSFLLMLQDRRVEQERQAAEIDVLTQLPNRRSLERQIAELLPLVQRQGCSLAVMLLDIDHFKQVNDKHGHAVGDSVLQHVARVLRREVRQGELLARYGGEEFIVVLPFADPPSASAAAQRIVLAVASTPLQRGDQALTVTLSAGVHVQRLAPRCPDGTSGQAAAPWEPLVQQADMALYDAKHGGRNRYVLSPAGTDFNS